MEEIYYGPASVLEGKMQLNELFTTKMLLTQFVRQSGRRLLALKENFQAFNNLRDGRNMTRTNKFNIQHHI